MATTAQTASTTRIIKASRASLSQALATRYRLSALEADRIIRAWLTADEIPVEKATTLPLRA